MALRRALDRVRLAAEKTVYPDAVEEAHRLARLVLFAYQVFALMTTPRGAPMDALGAIAEYLEPDGAHSVPYGT